jgi:hypothetical protein
MLARIVIVAATAAALLAAPAQAAPPPPTADGIIAVLIGVKQAPAAPLGSIRDGGLVYGSGE